MFAGANNTTIDNSGTIVGAVQDDGAVGPLTVFNSGTFMGGSFAIQGTAYNDGVTNSGTIHGSIDLGTGTDIVNNDGKIVGYVAFEGTADQLDNSGSIKGNVYMGSGDSVINTGVIHGNVTFAGGINTLNTSHGEITGTVTGGSGSDTFIAGSAAVTFIGGSGTEVLTGGAGDDVITAGSGKDTITGGKGDDILTGGKSVDTFIYSGNFGNDTIINFNTHHDIIHFAANDFASYSALEPHMVQAGADVVITLDASDSIVLTNQTLSNFSASDFTFG
jgi:Ca2+-binding RTX toxin-like protein